MHLLGKAIDTFSMISKKSLSLFKLSRVTVVRFIIARKRKFDKKNFFIYCLIIFLVTDASPTFNFTK